MSKVENITPEEREYAIYTIGKLGEEMTDERIEYYVQLRRNTAKHQEEKAYKEAVGQVTEQTKEFARKVLTYMGRSKSDRQIVVYSRKHTEILNYMKENNLDVDYTPSILGEAIFFMEAQKSTTIHHLTAEDLVNCLKDKKEELINNRNKREEIKKEWRSNAKKENKEDVARKAARLIKIAFWVGVILVLAPFFVTGFGFGWFWYLIIIGVAFFCLSLLGTNGKDNGAYSDAKNILIGFCVVGCLMYLWGPLNPNYGRSRESTFGSSSESSDEVMYYKGEKLHKVYDKCAGCGNSFWYWKSESSSLTIDKPKAWHGELYCGSCYTYKKDMEEVAKKAANKFQHL